MPQNPFEAASTKFSYALEAGQVVENGDGSVYRVSAKLGQAGESTFRLVDPGGKASVAASDFRPLPSAHAHFAARLRYILAYSRDFDTFVKAYIEQAKLPIDPDMDWSKWFGTMGPKLLASASPDIDLQDEAIYQVIDYVLQHRRALLSFRRSIKNFPKGVLKLPLAKQVTEVLKKDFTYQLLHPRTKKYIYNLHDPREVPLEQPRRGEPGLYNILDTTEHATDTSAFEGAESEQEVGQLRKLFADWLEEHESAIAGKRYLVLFDLFWQLSKVSGKGEKLTVNDLVQEWIRQTDLGLDALKGYYSNLPQMLKLFVRDLWREGKGNDLEVMGLLRGLVPKPKALARGAHTGSQEKQSTEPLVELRDDSYRKIAMNLQPVTGKPFYATCLHCGQRKLFGEGDDRGEAIGGYADLDGEAFKAYYCNSCVGEIKREEQAQADQKTFEENNPGSNVTTTPDTFKPRGSRMEKLLVRVDPDCITNLCKQAAGRNCELVEWNPGQWYYILEHKGASKAVPDWRENAQAYGPFASEQEALAHLDSTQGRLGGYGLKPHKAERQQDPVLARLIQQASKAPAAESHSVPLSTAPAQAVNAKVAVPVMNTPPHANPAVPQIPPSQQNQNPPIAVVPEEAQPDAEGITRKTVPPELPNSRYHMAAELPSSQDTPEMRKRIELLLEDFPATAMHQNVTPVYEHGHWWAICSSCGAIWDVVDSGSGAWMGLLEEIEEGDNSCFDNNSKEGEEKFGSDEAKVAYEPDANSGIRGSNEGVYIYQADVWCHDCAVKVAQQLDAAGKGVPHPEDEHSYDSDNYPKGPFFEEESDTPEHCSGCGKFLENPLTQEGYRYLAEQVAEARREGSHKDQDVIQQWIDFYGDPTGDESMEKSSTDKTADDPLKCCNGYHGRHRSNCPEYSKKFDDTIDKLKNLPKKATGEMSSGDLAEHGREEYPLHYAVADAFGGSVEPFDVYQGPYIRIPNERGRIFMETEDGGVCRWFNEFSGDLSPEFWYEDENAAVGAAISILENPPDNTQPYGAEREQVFRDIEEKSQEKEKAAPKHRKNWVPKFDEADKIQLHGLGVKGSQQQN